MTEYDSPWKEFLDNYLRAFLEFSFCDLHDQIDWSYEVVMRDKELQQIAPESESGLRIVDKLAEVKMLGGDIQWLLIHVEVQSQKTDSFAERMFTCFYRILDKYNKPIVSLAILGDDNPSWRPYSYSQKVFGSKIEFSFETIKLLDYLKDIEALESSSNPFAMIALTHLMTMQTANELHSRHLWKVRLMRLLHKKGYSAEEIRRLFRVIDWMMDLPLELEIQFKTEIETIEQEKVMDNVVTVHSLGKAEGREEGTLIGKIHAYESLLNLQPSDETELLQQPLDELTKFANELQSKVLKQMHTK